MGASQENTLFVGDSNVDIRTARNGNLTSCGVLWGFRTRKELEDEGADFIAENPSELVQTFSKNYEEKYGSTPEIYAATYYNGVYAFADAAKRATSLESADSARL